MHRADHEHSVGRFKRVFDRGWIIEVADNPGDVSRGDLLRFFRIPRECENLSALFRKSLAYSRPEHSRCSSHQDLH